MKKIIYGLIISILLIGCKEKPVMTEDVRELYEDYYAFISDSETQEYFDDFMIAQMYETLYLLVHILNGNCSNPETVMFLYDFVDFKYFSHQNLLLNMKSFARIEQPQAIEKTEYLRKIEEAKQADKHWSLGKSFTLIGDLEDGFCFRSISFRKLDIENGKIVPISYEQRAKRDYFIKED